VNFWEGSEPCEGKVFGFDTYYKVAVVKIRSSSELPVGVSGASECKFHLAWYAKFDSIRSILLEAI